MNEKNTFNQFLKLFDQLSFLELKNDIDWILTNNSLPVIQYYAKTIVQEYVIEIGATKDLLIAKLLETAGLVKATTFADFSTEYDNIQPEIVDKYKNLEQLLQSNLNNLREYVIGGMAVYHIYSIGEREGDYFGVLTIGIYTWNIMLFNFLWLNV
jgi:hypothetical protein